ncbi:MAG: hypothetical protein K2Q09_00040 [Phycisphaerales bacterium]|nr:hypothetical protein [Phycisphaerales bacterium]
MRPLTFAPLAMTAAVAAAQPVVPGASVQLLATLPNGYRPSTADWGLDPRPDRGHWLYFGSDNNAGTGVALVRVSTGDATVGPGQVQGLVETYTALIYDPDGILVDRSGNLTGTPGQVLAACADDPFQRGRIWRINPAEAAPPDTVAPTHDFVAPLEALNNADAMTTDDLGRLYIGVPPFDQIARMIGTPQNGGASLEVFANLPAAPGILACDASGAIWSAGADGVLRRLPIDGPLPRTADLAVDLGTGTDPGLTWSRAVPGIGGPWGGGMLVVRRGVGTGDLVRVRRNGRIDLLGTNTGDVYAMTVDGDGVLYTADYSTGQVWRIARTSRLGCGPGDLGGPGGFPVSDGALDNNDFIAFIDLFFSHDPTADTGRSGGVRGQDGTFDNNDFIAFIDAFFEGC